MSLQRSLPLLAALLCVVAAQTTDPQTNNSSTLRLIHILYRHGDRTPIKAYPTDPYRNVSSWPVSWGQLTNEGKERHYKLGQYNRQRYGQFLSEAYNSDEVFIRSTDVDRTLMSAECHLAGLFPPTPNQTWNPDLQWQPIPIHTVPKDTDLLLVLESKCPYYDELFTTFNASPEVREKMESNKQLLDYLAQNSGVNMTEMDDIEYLYDTLFIEARYNKTLPKWTNKVFPDQMKQLSDFSFAMKAYTNDMQRLRGGPWVKELVEHFKQYVTSTLTPPNRKLFMYSGHDVSVSTVLSALKVFNNIQPPYASMILVELHELKTKEFFVKVLYKNVSDDGLEAFPLTLPGCVELCPLDEFIKLTKGVVSDDIEAECKLTQPQNTINNILVTSILGSLVGLLLLALVIVAAVWYRKTRADNGYVYSSIQGE